MEEEKVEKKTETIKEEKKSKKGLKITLTVISLVVVVGLVVGLIVFNNRNPKDKLDEEKETITVDSDYKMSGNNVQEFDLFFLKSENETKNKVYSPLSIKYALGMLNEGTDGETKAQISAVIGDYVGKKYVNSKNMSLANALYINESMQNNIKTEYINTLKDKYNASVFYDPFKNPNNINKWVSDNTYNLIPDLLDDVMDKDFILINTLAIDMEWVNKIQSENEFFSVDYPHEEYYVGVDPLNSEGYSELKFDNLNYSVKSVKIAASANRYDIVSDLTESSIRNTVTSEYNKFVKNEECGTPGVEYNYEPTKSYVDKYMKEINSSYGKVESSTDFYFYVDNDVKVFAKDLKEYDGTTLQYVGIMPTSTSLDSYINNVSAKQVEELIGKLKDPKKIESYTDGKITKLTGQIPVFNFDYELNLINDLKKLGITNVFDGSKADLSKLTSNKGTYIDTALHKANIEFSNTGIRATAATAVGGYGAADCGFDYLYKVPVEEINLTFDKPFMFLIRDKATGEIWFTGTVYEPTKITDLDLNGPEY